MAAAWADSVALGRGSSSGATRLQRPAPAAGPMRPSRVGRPRARPTAGPLAGRSGAPCRSGRRGPQRGERVVGDLAGPHQVPQRGEQLVVGGTDRAGAQLAPEARPAARRAPSGSASWIGWSGRSTCSQLGASSASWSAKQSRTRPSLEPIAPAPTHTTSPDVHSSSSSAGRYSATRAASTSGSSVDATIGAPASTPDAPRRAARRRAGSVPTPCHAGRNAASAACSTGSTSRRSAASERRRSWRSTSTSHHSRRTPSGRNSPRTTRSSASRAPRAPSDPRLRDAEAGGEVALDERAVGAGVAADEILERARHRIGEHLRQAEGQRCSRARRDSGRRRRRRRSASRRRRRPRWRGARRPARRAAHGRWCRSRPTPRSAASSSSSVRSPTRRSTSCSSSARAGPAPVGEALQVELDVGEHPRVEQLAQLLGAEQVGEQVAVEGERRRPPLGERGVALVHVGGDPVEQQALGHRADGLVVSTVTMRTVRERSWPSTSRSAGTSNTSCRHSRDASSRIGNVGYLAATASRSAARWRCCHSGVRRSGRRRGSSSERARRTRGTATRTAPSAAAW